MARVTQLIHDAGKYLLISVYPLPTHPTHNFTHNNGGNLETLPGWPKKLQHNRPARSAGQKVLGFGAAYIRDLRVRHISVIASQITSKLFVTVFVQADNKGNIKAQHNWHFVRGIHLVTGEFMRGHFVHTVHVYIPQNKHLILLCFVVFLFLLTCAPRRSIVLQFFWSARKCL